MGEYPRNPGPLPAEEFCNKSGKKNPISGNGPLGNQYAGKMSYNEPDREDHVRTVQTMLLELGYDIGLTESDGKFGNATEEGVREFQKEHLDWEGNALNVDGLVGPETSDALNREMVGRWYDSYPTPVELSGKMFCYTIIESRVRGGLDIAPGKAESVSMFIVQPAPGGFVPWVDFQTVDDFGHRLGEKTIVLTFPDGATKELTTSAKGYWREKRVPKGTITITLPDGSPAKMLSKDGERDAVITAENVRYAIVDVIVEHRASDEVKEQRETNRKLYARVPGSAIQVTCRKRAYDHEKGEFTGESKKEPVVKSWFRAVDNLALAAGWTDDVAGVNTSRFAAVLSGWLNDYFPVAAERGYIVHLVEGSGLRIFDRAGKELGSCRLTEKIQGPIGAYSPFADEKGSVFVDMTNRKYSTPVKGNESAVLRLDEIVDKPDMIRKISDNNISKVNVLYLLPGKSELYWLAHYGGTGALEDYGIDSAVNRTIHERNLAVVNTVVRSYEWYLKDYIDLVKKTGNENDLRALGPPAQPYIFPVPAGATEGQEQELSRANTVSSFMAWKAIGEHLSKLAGEIPDGTFYLSLKVEMDKIAGGEKFPVLNGGSVKINFYFEDDLTPVILEPEIEVKIGAEHDVTVGPRAVREDLRPGTLKDSLPKNTRQIKIGVSYEQKMNVKTGETDCSYKIRAGAGEVEITPKGDMKIEVSLDSALKDESNIGVGVYAEVSPYAGQFGGGLSLSVGKAKLYIGIHFLGLRPENLLAYFCKAPGFFERRGLSDLMNPGLLWADLFPDEEMSLKALGFTQRTWDRRYIKAVPMPETIRKSFDDLDQKQKCAAVIIGLRRGNWDETWKQFRR